VLRTLNAKETAVAMNDGRWFTVRIMPYRTLENRIHGAVNNFIDVTAVKTLEAKLRRQAGHEATP
jgi:two-component system CheB/CheR fusion protein